MYIGVKCKIPSLWKRFGAEFIDFILLSLIKFVVAYFFVDSMFDMYVYFNFLTIYYCKVMIHNQNMFMYEITY